MGNPMRNNATRIKEIRAVELAATGMTQDEIARELGYANRGGVSKALKRTLDRNEVQAVEELRAVEDAKLDARESEAETLIAQAFAEGDADTWSKLASTYLKLMERRAKNNGTDAPVKSEVDVKGTGFQAVAVPANRLPAKAQARLAEEAAAQAEQE